MSGVADILLPLLLFFTFLMSALFSGSETGLISLNRIALRRKEEEGEPRSHTRR